MVAEISAEGGYPVGEAITFGLLTAMEYGIIFVILMTMQTLVSPILPADEQIALKTKYIPFYLFLICAYAVMTLISMYITYKHEPVLHRYMEDRVNPPEYLETNGGEKDEEGAGSGQGKSV